MSRSVNMAIVIGNLTRDPEMRYTPNGNAVTSFGIATNRTWSTEGEKKEDVEFHNIVAWNKLAELCSQLLMKGRRVYVQGRLQTRTWDGQDGVKRTKTEIVADEMIILDDKFKEMDSSNFESGVEAIVDDTQLPEVEVDDGRGKSADELVGSSKKDKKTGRDNDEELSTDDIPF